MASEARSGKKEFPFNEEEEQKLHNILRASIDSFIENRIEIQSGTGKKVVDAGFPELADDEWSREATNFLVSLDPEALERRIFDEARRGDTALLLAFLGASLAESEMFFGIEDFRLVDDTKPHEYIDRQFPELFSFFDKLLSGSHQFAKEYTKKDFVEWLQNKKDGLERAERLNFLSKRGRRELMFLKRFEEGASRPEDVEILQRMVESEFSMEGGIMEIDILNVLREEAGAREGLRQRLEGFLLLHRFSLPVIEDLLGGDRDKGKTAP